MLLPEAIRALLKTPCLAQLPAQLLLVSLLHGFDGWKHGREAEGIGEGSAVPNSTPSEPPHVAWTQEQGGVRKELDQAVSRTEWLWVTCSPSLSLPGKGEQSVWWTLLGDASVVDQWWTLVPVVSDGWVRPHRVRCACTTQMAL